MNTDKQISTFIKAKQFEREGQYQLALENYEQALAEGVGDEALSYQGKARSLIGLGRLDEALADCQKALSLNPNLGVSYRAMGYIYDTQEKYDLAEEAYLAAIKTDPVGIVGLGNLSSLYFFQKRYEEAIVLLEKYLTHKPNHYQKRMELVYSYIGIINIREASKHAKMVIKTKPTAWQAYRVLFGLLLFIIVNTITSIPVILYFLSLIIVIVLPAFGPTFLSVPIGILLSIFGIRYLIRNNSTASIRRKISIILMGCCYWYFVFMHWAYVNFAYVNR